MPLKTFTHDSCGSRVVVGQEHQLLVGLHVVLVHLQPLDAVLAGVDCHLGDVAVVADVTSDEHASYDDDFLKVDLRS